MNVSVSSADGVTFARLTGEFDTYSAPSFRRALADVMVTPGSRVVVDLRNVSFIDSSGLGVVIALHHRVTEAGGHLQLVCGGVTQRLIELTRLDQVIEVTTELEEGGTGVGPC